MMLRATSFLLLIPCLYASALWGIGVDPSLRREQVVVWAVLVALTVLILVMIDRIVAGYVPRDDIDTQRTNEQLRVLAQMFNFMCIPFIAAPILRPTMGMADGYLSLGNLGLLVAGVVLHLCAQRALHHWKGPKGQPS
jgi:hypothetical protein